MDEEDLETDADYEPKQTPSDTEIFRHIFSVSTSSTDYRFFSVRVVLVITIVSSLFHEIHFYILLCPPDFDFDSHLVPPLSEARV